MNIFTSKIKMLQQIKLLQQELEHEYALNQYYQNKIDNLTDEINRLREKHKDYLK